VANQAIALQSRAPQSNLLGGAIQQGAQMMNMMSQQRAAQRQAAQATQAMEIARAGEERAASAAEIDMAGKKIDFYTKRAGQTMTPEGYSLLLKDLDKDAPEIAAAFRANLPEVNFNRDELLKMVGSISDNFRARFGALETEVVQLKNGKYAVARIGGSGGPGAEPGVFELEEYELDSNRGAAAPAQTPTAAFPTTAAPATDAQIDDAARKILRGAGVGDLGIGADDFDRASERANQMKAGGDASMRPVSMTTGPQMGGGQPDLAAVVQDMMSSGQISQANLQLMRDTAGPANDAQLAEILRANNIQIVPDAEPSMRSAVFRPGEDATPQMQQVQDMRNYRATGRAAQGKDPMQSPSQAPGAAGAVAEAQREPIPQAGARAGAETAGEQGVRVVTQPKIVAGEERAKRVEKLRGELPRARADAQALITDLDERIKAIDEFLRSPYRNSIIGAVEGRIPRMLQTPARADAQALYDSIKDNTTLTRLLSDRSQTETGASPMGVVSDRDVDMVARGATRLTQTGTEKQQEIEMQRLRDMMYKTRQLAVETYNNVYREVLPEAPNLSLRVPSIAPKYRAKPGTPTQGKSQLSPEVAKKYGL
jgi:hypothetical protein